MVRLCVLALEKLYGILLNSRKRLLVLELGKAMTERLEAGVNRNLSGEVIPLDYGLAHEPIRKGGEPRHPGDVGLGGVGWGG